MTSSDAETDSKPIIIIVIIIISNVTNIVPGSYRKFAQISRGLYKILPNPPASYMRVRVIKN